MGTPALEGSLLSLLLRLLLLKSLST